MRLKLTVEYDGTGFRGWARQPGERTVEGELRRALGELYGPWAAWPSRGGRTPASTRSRTSCRWTWTAARPPSGRRRR